MNQLEKILTSQGVENRSKNALLEAFGAPFEEAGIILADYQNIVVTDENDTEMMSLARQKRLALKKTRTTVENKRKELKENSLREGRAIDSVAKFVKEVIAPAETYLQSQEDFVKIREAARLEKIRAERTEKICQYADPSLYNLDAMDDVQFERLVVQLKEDFERAEKERVAEEERIVAEQEAEKERVRLVQLENVRLKLEAEAEREKIEALERAERERQAAEAKVKAEREAAERAALLAPDREKVDLFADFLQSICEEKLPTVDSAEAQWVIERVANWLADCVEVLRAYSAGF